MHGIRLALVVVVSTLVACSAKPERAAEGRQTPTETETPYEDLRGNSGCSQNCSGHEAGYRWGETHDILTSEECGGGDESFKEGCRSYVEDQAAKAVAR
jgi:hypothetical protein